VAPPDRSQHHELDRYLLDGERLVTAVHQHWGKVAEPIASMAAGLALALWVDATIDPALGLLSTILWWVWFAVVLRALYLVAEWRHDWFIATDKRLLLFYGFITRKVSMMPLMKVTDMSYERSIPGRIFGYGRFVMESAGQDQALHKVNWVPQPDHHYRAICAEIFGVFDHERVTEPPPPDWDGGAPGDGPPGEGPQGGGPSAGGLPDPYSGWNSPRHRGTHSGSLYRSPDLQARDRSADTGPIPIRPFHPPRDLYDD
jgi:hypothetical protein